MSPALLHQNQLVLEECILTPALLWIFTITSFPPVVSLFHFLGSFQRLAPKTATGEAISSTVLHAASD